MRHYWLSAFSFLAALLLHVFAAPLQAWDDIQVKHSWNTVPINWESLGHPPAGTTMNLYIGLKPDREGALIGALSEVSNPRHPRHVVLIHPPLEPSLMYAAAPFQIWCLPFKRTGC